MRKGHLLFSAVEFLLISALFLLGGVCIALHYLPDVRANLFSWLITPNSTLHHIGYFILSVALLLTLGFWAMQRKSYLRIQLDPTSFSVDEQFVRQWVSRVWEEEWPELESPSDVYLSTQKIEVITHLPQEIDTEKKLEEIEMRLGSLLEKQLGYKRAVFITLDICT